MAARAARVRLAEETVAGEHLGAGLIELPRRESTFPYHYELGDDELLAVVLGRPTVRTPEGERELAVGDCVLFPSRPAEAHEVTNHSTETVRVLLVSNFALPRAAVQVDSGKLMLRWGPGRDERRWSFLGEDADYWDGEPNG